MSWVIPVLLFDSLNSWTKAAKIVPNDICKPPTPNKERETTARINHERFESTNVALSFVIPWSQIYDGLEGTLEDLSVRAARRFILAREAI